MAVELNFDAGAYRQAEQERYKERLNNYFGVPAATEPWSPEGMAQAAKQKGEAEAMLRAASAAAVERARAECDITTATESAALVEPPGLAGELVRWCKASALYPVQEVAIATVIGILAGLTGRAWTAPSPRLTGLNVYLVLVARSASGKEALHDLAGVLLVELRKLVPGVTSLINFNDHVSGPALAKSMAAEPRCCVTFSSEFGRKLRRMASPKDRPMQDFRTTMTTLYSKSGPTSYVGDMVYSDSNARVSIPGAVAFSLVGESTPATVHVALTEEIAEEGLLSRMHFVEVLGERPEYNEGVEGALPPLPTHVLEALKEVAVQALTLLGRNETQPVAIVPEAKAVLDGFRKVCNEEVKAAGDNNLLRGLSSRAHLKALKYAGHLAVLECPLRPVVTLEQAQWAIAFAAQGVAVMRRRFEAGDVGSGDDTRERKVVEAVTTFFRSTADQARGYMRDSSVVRIAALQKEGLVPRRYLQARLSRGAAFSQHPFGSKRALDDALASLCATGHLEELDRAKETKVVADFGPTGRLYRWHG